MMRSSMYKWLGFLFLCLFVSVFFILFSTQPELASSSISISPPPFNYGEALDKSWLFYEAQRSGDTTDPAYTTRVSWRVPSALTDGSDVGLDLTGGWYDAGDHVKFGLPMASSATMLAWGVIEYPSAYVDSGTLPAALDSLRWVNDYFIKAHPAPNEFYAQVGEGWRDHSWWGPPELMTMPRYAFKVDPTCPGSDVAGETAAAMSAASIIFRGQGETTYADTLLTHADQLYTFADTYRGLYHLCVADAGTFYPSSDYLDELLWGALWLHKAHIAQNPTYGDSYLTTAENLFSSNGSLQNVRGWTQNWSDKVYGSYILLAQLTGSSVYQDDAENWLNDWLPGGTITYSPGGQAWLSTWGSLRYAGNTAFLAMIYSDWLVASGGDAMLAQAYFDFGEAQINYVLGDNPRNSSYMVGFGTNPPTRPHHAGSHYSLSNNIYDPVEQTYILYGGIVGGPEAADDFTVNLTDRNNYISNEVATDYNAGITGGIARLYAKYNSGPTPTPTPSPTPCPMMTPEPFWVEPVLSPTNLLTQTISVAVGGGKAVTITTESGVFVSTGDFSTASPAQIEIALLPNTRHHLMVSAHVNPSPCANYLLTTTVDNVGVPLEIDQIAPPNDAGMCQVEYTIATDWGTGFTADPVTITNNSRADIDGWTLEWDFAGNQQLNTSWNSTYAQTGTHVTLYNETWNRTLPNGSSTGVGFNANYSGINDDPTSFTLNGMPCGELCTPLTTTPVVTITPPMSNTLWLAWSEVTGATIYELWSLPAPYQALGADCANPTTGASCAWLSTNSYSEILTVGDLNTPRYFAVVPRNGCTITRSASSYVGRFSYDIYAGMP